MPAVVVPPVSQGTAPDGTISFSVSATGAGTLAYQWQKNTTNLVNGAVSGRATVSGATTTALLLSGITTNDQANYACRITNNFGSITSSVAALTVYLAPSIVNQPAGKTNAVGTNVSFAVFASGTAPLYYQWQKNGSVIAYATLNVFSINGISTNDNGDYTVTVSNPAGQTSSSAAHLLVLNPPKITGQPVGSTNQLGTLNTFSVSATGDILGYQWKFNGTNISGTSNSSLTITNIQYADEGTYSAVVTNLVGAVTSVGAQLTLLKPPLISSGPSHIVPWGNSYYGETNIPKNLTNVVAIAAGFNHFLALNRDGTVVAWGDNQLDETNVPMGLTNVSAIAAGELHSLALLTDGSVVSWGRYFWNGSSYVSVPVPDNVTNVTAIAAGIQNLALKSDGTVVQWGSDDFNATNSPTNLSNVVAIAAGRYDSLALRIDGTVVAWGDNSYGQTNVPTSLTNAVAIAACGYHCIGLRSNGTVIEWGWATNTPANLSNVVAIAAGYRNSVALNGDGTVTAWGDNDQNQTNAPYWLVNVTAIAASGFHSLALTHDKLAFGSSFAWNVTASGTPPLGYRWQRDGLDIVAAAESLFTKTNADTSDTGSYCVIITNAYGSVTSSIVTIAVGISPQMITANFVSNQGVKLKMIGTPNFPYALQSTTNLLPPIRWLPVQTNSADTNGVWQFMDTNLNNAQKFYRVTTP